jgi:hypothetical protein
MKIVTTTIISTAAIVFLSVLGLGPCPIDGFSVPFPTTGTTSVPTTTRLYHNNNNNKKSTASSKRRSGGGFGTMANNDPAKKKDSFPYAGTIRPGRRSPQRVVTTPDMLKPDYWETGIPDKKRASRPLLPWMIEVKNPEEIEKMRKAGRLARHVLDMAGRAVAPGVTTDAIDTLVHEEIVRVRSHETLGKRYGECLYLTLYIKHSFSYFCTLLLDRMAHTHRH